jgi:hypothetical protein
MRHLHANPGRDHRLHTKRRTQGWRLATDGRLVIVDRGLPYYSEGSMILGLVAHGETAEVVLRRAATRGNVINRRRFRDQLAAGKYEKPKPLAIAS